MKIGHRITLGYSIVILATLAVGTVSVLRTHEARKEVKRLDTAYLPEMASGSTIERNAWALFFHMRGFVDNLDQAELANAKKRFAMLEGDLATARQLANQQALESFQDLQEKASGTLASYGKVMASSENAVTAMLAQRKPLNESIEQFLQQCDSFVTDQTNALTVEVARAQKTISLAQDVYDHGTQARIFSYEAQSANNPALFNSAAEQLGALQEKADQLLAIETTESGKEMVAAIKASAAGYSKAIKSYYELVSDEEEIDVLAMMESREAMKKTAETFSTGIQAFLIRQNEAINANVNQRLNKVEVANRVYESGTQINSSSHKAGSERNLSSFSKTLDSFSTVFGAITELKATTADPVEISFIEGIEASASQSQQAMKKYYDAWSNLEGTRSARQEAFNSFLGNAEAMAAQGYERAVSSSKTNASGLAASSTIVLIGVAVAVAFGVVLAFLSVRSISKVLRELASKLNKSSSTVGIASRQVSEASRELAEGSSQQAASVEETSSSLEELASMTRQNADNARKANETMQSTGQVVAEASKAMVELTQSIKEIAEGSKETQKIIKTIDEIAFQTNLLALNAAVEAARAGEAGAGFAVVADEVRNLAIRAAEAARNTAGLIEGSVKKIELGSTLLSRTNDAFTRVAEQTEAVRGRIGEIATASGEQSNGIEQINKAVSEMDRVVQRNASGAEETASAAGELNAQAGNLNRAVDDLNALLEGKRRLSASEASLGLATGAASIGDDFDFDMTGGTASSSHEDFDTSNGPIHSPLKNGSSNGVIRDSEMSHDDFEFDEADFDFGTEDSLEGPNPHRR